MSSGSQSVSAPPIHSAYAVRYAEKIIAVCNSFNVDLARRHLGVYNNCEQVKSGKNAKEQELSRGDAPELDPSREIWNSLASQIVSISALISPFWYPWSTVAHHPPRNPFRYCGCIQRSAHQLPLAP